MDQIIQPVKEYILSTYLKGEDPSALKDTTPLITGGILDSLGTLELVSFLSSASGSSSRPMRWTPSASIPSRPSGAW